ncbi:MAG: OmpA family protein [Thiohalomonadales bacterium]
MFHKFTNSAQISQITLLTLLSITLIGSGCVSQSKYDQLLGEHDALIIERDQLNSKNSKLTSNLSDVTTNRDSLNDKLDNINSDLATTTKQLDTTRAELNTASSELNTSNQQLSQRGKQLTRKNQLLANTIEELTFKEEQLRKSQKELEASATYMERTNKLYDDLVGELKDELQSNEVKIKQLEDGLSLNLSDDILFSSGSAKLNKRGAEVIKKVSERLTNNKYVVIVAGYTDNLPIHGTLIKKFPSNWELAAARAASVVRLLEKHGVNSSKLRAVSYGENRPVAPNDSNEGRSLNRRIEIQLKAVKKKKST